jgi:hypothetical protein
VPLDEVAQVVSGEAETSTHAERAQLAGSHQCIDGGARPLECPRHVVDLQQLLDRRSACVPFSHGAKRAGMGDDVQHENRVLPPSHGNRVKVGRVNQLVAERARMLREAAGLTQSQAAELLRKRGWTDATAPRISEIERRKRHLKVEEALAMSDVYGAGTEWFT